MVTKKTVVKALYYTGQTVGSLAMLRLAFTPAGLALMLLYVVTQTAHGMWLERELLEKALNKENSDV